LELARQALADRKLEPARQLLQQAGQMGSADASNLIARMYDPETWRADASPLAQPDWETAVYWYEIAARADDVSGKLGAGRLLCQHSSIDFDRKRGLDYLRQAAAAGSAEAKPLLTVCEEKLS
jgi:TPR repeat protein